MSHGNGSSQGKRQKKQLSNNEKIYEKRIRSGYGRYIVPGAIGTVVILLIPFIANIWISLHSWRGGRSKMKFIGLDNYVKLLGDEKVLDLIFQFVVHDCGHGNYSAAYRSDSCSSIVRLYRS